jgi:GNAT superfamily N-acetyltransferase
MADHVGELAPPFIALGLDLDSIYYFGESMLLPEWRGRGIGGLFFDRREARARELDYPIASFCSVIRPPDHPARPAGYRPLDNFWRARGYAPVEGLTTQFSWKEVGDASMTRHPMLFWVKHLTNAPHP